MKTRAAVLYNVQEPMKIEELELDEPKPGEVRVKMVAAGMCHSDWHLVTGDSPAMFPIILGHEGAGVVDAVGPGVARTKPGDHVVLTFIPSCGHCKWCVNGMAQLCDLGAHLSLNSQLDDTYRFHNKDGQDIGQYLLVSTFAEYTVVPEASVCVIDKSLPLDKACLVGCGVATGYGAATNRAKVTPGSTVLVVGVGGIGTNVVQGASASSASMVIAADIFDHKLEWAKEFGATHTINAKKDDLVSKVMEMTNGQGVDFAFEAIGTPETVGQAFAATGKGGTTVAIGVNPWSAETLPISPFMLTLYQKSLMGTLYGTSNPQTEIPKLLNLYKVGKLKLDQLITKTYKLDDVNEGYADMIGGKNIRGVIMFD
jgi:S-(hydroxymethyl)glutathione dehydrogenase/alcohol dehydrogenase